MGCLKFKMKKYKRLQEKPAKNLKQILTGIHPYAYSFGIMTAENPMGKKLSSSNNKKLNDDFWDYLQKGRYQYIKIQGKYGNVEHPALIINIPLKTLLYLGNKYNQESVIWGDIKGIENVVFEYWERNSENEPLKKKDTETYFVNETNAGDFYTHIKNWKFNIPFPVFQEVLEIWYHDKIEILNEESKKEIKKVILKIVENNEAYTEHHFYRLRGDFNYIVNMAKGLEKK